MNSEPKLSEEEIKAAIEKLSDDLPYMKQVSPGLWKISTGGKEPIIMYTGDGGAEEFRNALKKANEEFQKS